MLLLKADVGMIIDSVVNQDDIFYDIIKYLLFFLIIILITHTYKTKKYSNHQVLSSTWEKEKNKLK